MRDWKIFDPIADIVSKEGLTDEEIKDKDEFSYSDRLADDTILDDSENVEEEVEFQTEEEYYNSLTPGKKAWFTRRKIQRGIELGLQNISIYENNEPTFFIKKTMGKLDKYIDKIEKSVVTKYLKEEKQKKESIKNAVWDAPEDQDDGMKEFQKHTMNYFKMGGSGIVLSLDTDELQFDDIDSRVATVFEHTTGFYKLSESLEDPGNVYAQSISSIKELRYPYSYASLNLCTPIEINIERLKNMKKVLNDTLFLSFVFSQNGNDGIFIHDIIRELQHIFPNHMYEYSKIFYDTNLMCGIILKNRGLISEGGD